MQVQPISDTKFEAKNTFLNKSKNAVIRQDKDYWKSLHCEAKARLYYQKFEKADRQLDTVEDTGSLNGMLTLLSVLSVMALRKLQSVIYQTNAHSAFPNRFAEPDEFDVKDERHYKIKESYSHLIKQ